MVAITNDERYFFVKICLKKQKDILLRQDLWKLIIYVEFSTTYSVQNLVTIYKYQKLWEVLF